jgi:hypothetical protein
MDAEERFAALVERLSSRPGVTLPGGPGSRGFGRNALKVDGAIFVMPWRGGLAFKLPRQRVEALLAEGTGVPFDAGKGRPMREWVAIPDGAAVDDAALADEALAFVGKRTG